MSGVTFVDEPPESLGRGRGAPWADDAIATLRRNVGRWALVRKVKKGSTASTVTVKRRLTGENGYWDVIARALPDDEVDGELTHGIYMRCREDITAEDES